MKSMLHFQIGIEIFTTLKKSKEKILVRVSRKYISFVFKCDNKELLK